MLHIEEGPWGIFQWVRERFGVLHDADGQPEYPAGSVFACIGCLSVWMAILLWVLPHWVAAILAGTALAVFAQVIWERLTR